MKGTLVKVKDDMAGDAKWYVVTGASSGEQLAGKRGSAWAA